MATGVLGNLRINVSVATGQVTKGFRQVQSQMASFTGSISSAGTSLTGFAARAAGVAAAIIGVRKAFDAVSTGIATAVDRETAGVQFQVILGSAEKAKKAISDLTKFAEQTPFELPQLRDAAKSLLAFGVPAENMIGTLRQLGDVSALSGKDLGELATMYGKARINQRLFADDVTRFAEAGLPIYDVLTRKFGVTGAELTKMVEKGGASFADLQEALRMATEEGGKFAGGMSRLSTTTAGLWSTLKDNITGVLGDMGEAFANAFDFKGIMTSTIAWVNEWRPVVVVLFQDAITWVKTFVAEAVAMAKTLVGGNSFVSKSFELLKSGLMNFGEVFTIIKLGWFKVQEYIAIGISKVLGWAETAVSALASILPDDFGGDFLAGISENIAIFQEDFAILAEERKKLFDAELVKPDMPGLDDAFDALQKRISDIKADAAKANELVTTEIPKPEPIELQKTIELKPPEMKSVAAASKGSQEAESLISAALRDRGKQTEEKQLAEQMKTNRKMDQLIAALGAGIQLAQVGI